MLQMKYSDLRLATFSSGSASPCRRTVLRASRAKRAFDVGAYILKANKANKFPAGLNDFALDLVMLKAIKIVEGADHD
jgi:hypothetical protein